MRRADPQFLAVESPRSEAVGRSARAMRCRSIAGRFASPSERETAKFTPTPLSGKPMADREAQLTARIAAGCCVDRCRRDGTCLPGPRPVPQPRLPRALEESGSVGEGTGWTPLPILVEREGAQSLAAAPAYLKTHSQGEYVFDHGWAEAWERAGGAYYPKLQVAVPFTPCPGGACSGEIRTRLLAAIEAVTVAERPVFRAHHFLHRAEDAMLPRRAAGCFARPAVSLAQPRLCRASTISSPRCPAASARRSARSARRRSRVWRSSTLRGAEIEPRHWDALWRFYQDTGARKWGQPYLTRDFFDRRRRGDGRFGADVPRASRRRPIAGALNFVGARYALRPLLGRDRGSALPAFRAQLLPRDRMGDRHGLASVQAGAQGEHKLARGYEPVVTRSAHFLPDRGFRGAVADFLVREREAMRPELEWCARGLALPFVPRRRPRPAARQVRPRPRYMPGVVKPQAASPDGATAISPPVPPMRLISARTASSACCSASPPIRTRRIARARRRRG